MRIARLDDLRLVPTDTKVLTVEAAGADLEGLGLLSRLPGLEALCLRDAELGDVELASLLVRLPTVRRLALSRCANVTDAAFSGLPSLEALSLLHCGGIVGSGLAALDGIERLELRWNPQVLPENLATSLPALHALRHLRLSQPLSGEAMDAIAGLPGLRELDLLHFQPISPPGSLARLAASSTLQRAQLDRPLSVEEAGALGEIKTLDHAWIRVNEPEDAKAAAALASLELVVGAAPKQTMSAETLGAVADHLPNVRELDLDPGFMGKLTLGSGLKDLLRLPQLRVLDLNRNKSLTLPDLESLAGHPALEVVNLNLCFKVKAGVVAVLQSFPRLLRAGLVDCKLTDASIKKLAALPLEHLELGGGIKLSDKALSALGKMETLRSLRLAQGNKGKFTEAGLESLKLLPIERLEIDFDSLAGPCGDALAQMRALEELRLGVPSMATDTLMPAFAAMPNLRFLTLTSGWAAPESIEKLQQSTSLKHVDLANYDMTESLRAQLASQGNLLLTCDNAPELPLFSLQAGWLRSKDLDPVAL